MQVFILKSASNQSLGSPRQIKHHIQEDNVAFARQPSARYPFGNIRESF